MTFVQYFKLCSVLFQYLLFADQMGLWWIPPPSYIIRKKMTQTYLLHTPTYINDVFGLRERYREEKKTQKLVNEFALKLDEIYSSIFIFFPLLYFSLSNQTHY
jgi:hypothetical protein